MFCRALGGRKSATAVEKRVRALNLHLSLSSSDDESNPKDAASSPENDSPIREIKAPTLSSEAVNASRDIDARIQNSAKAHRGNDISESGPSSLKTSGELSWLDNNSGAVSDEDKWSALRSFRPVASRRESASSGNLKAQKSPGSPLPASGVKINISKRRHDGDDDDDNLNWDDDAMPTGESDPIIAPAEKHLMKKRKVFVDDSDDDNF